MSFANICDRCGKVIGDRREDGEYMAVAILVDGEVAYSLDDACDSCRAELARMVDAFARPVPTPRESAPATEPARAAEPAEAEPPVREAAEEKPPAAQEASEEDAPVRPAHAAVDPDSLPNAVVRRFPLPEI